MGTHLLSSYHVKKTPVEIDRLNIAVREGARVACLAWRFWLGALSNKGERGQRYCEEIGASPLVRPARQNRHATQARARVSPPILRRLDGILSSLVALFVSIFFLKCKDVIKGDFTEAERPASLLFVG